MYHKLAHMRAHTTQAAAERRLEKLIRSGSVTKPAQPISGFSSSAQTALDRLFIFIIPVVLFPLIGLLPAIILIMLAHRIRKEIDAVVAAGGHPVNANTNKPVDRRDATDPMILGIAGIVMHGLMIVIGLLAYLFG